MQGGSKFEKSKIDLFDQKSGKILSQLINDIVVNM